jgi:hypothetical protein
MTPRPGGAGLLVISPKSTLRVGGTPRAWVQFPPRITHDRPFTRIKRRPRPQNLM